MIDPVSHPRPSLRRPFVSLDGAWELALDPDERWTHPGEVSFDREIKVPFAPESPAAGVGAPEQVDRCWYRRALDLGGVPRGQRHVVQFGAVDRVATVWANGEHVGSHVGGYTPFEVDVTEAASRATDGKVVLVVRAGDDREALDVPRGKQDWLDRPHAIWYPRTSGIWRSVFHEVRGSVHVDVVDIVGDPASMTMRVRIAVGGRTPPGARARLRITSEATGRCFVDDDLALVGDEIERTVAIGDGGMDDAWSLPWWPRRPHLFLVEVALHASDGEQLDAVETTAALRSVEVRDGQLCINGRPYPLRLALDQGYWPDSGATPPSLDALRTDLELTRALGFNGVRKHQKTEDPRFFALADRMGLLAWVEMPSAYRAGRRSAANLLHEWPEIVAAHRGFASVVAWVPVNESWAVPNIGQDPEQQALVEALTAITGAVDGTRPVSSNDGWETLGGDIIGVHDYEQDAAVLRQRYGTAAAVDAQLAGARFDGKRVDVRSRATDGRAVMLTEFGGVAMQHVDETASALGLDGSDWGYDAVRTADELVARVRELWAVVHDSGVLAGACWTQLTDTYQEVNGLLTFDRRPKAPLEDLSAAVRGRG